MGKTSEVHSDGAGVEARGQKAAGGAVKRRSDGAEDTMDAGEHLQQGFAKVRAKAAADPVLAPRTFSAAWTTDVMAEEAEAEFVDAVADCLGAGFSLESALTGWDNGTLAADGAAGEDGLFDDDGELDDEPAPALAQRHTPTGGRRIVMT